MESSIAEFRMRQSACELLPTNGRTGTPKWSIAAAERKEALWQPREPRQQATSKEGLARSPGRRRSAPRGQGSGGRENDGYIAARIHCRAAQAAWPGEGTP